MKAPIAIIIFNRPDHAAQLRQRLQPEESRDLFVISDGTREGRAGEAKLVDECRQIFADWPGEVHVNYAQQNLGCKDRVSSGLNWVFKQTERAIILEDDCLPHPDFFRFCDELLEAYAENETVMSVCGTKTFPQQSPTSDFIFTKYASSWGWATWRRAWEHYDDQFGTYAPILILKKLRTALGSYRAAVYWFYLIRKVHSGAISSWAYCWNITCFLEGGLHAYSNDNLVVNSGFGAEATHTTKKMPYMPNLYCKPLSFPLKISSSAIICIKADKWIENHIYSKSFGVRLCWIFDKLKGC